MLQSLEDRQAYVKEMHLLKTDLFMKLIEEGQLPLRPGVRRLIGAYYVGISSHASFTSYVIVSCRCEQDAGCLFSTCMLDSSDMLGLLLFKRCTLSQMYGLCLMIS